MPLVKPKGKPKPHAIYVAWTSFAWRDVVVKRGDRLRGDSAVVRHCFARFVEDGQPQSEWPSELDGFEVPQHAPEFHRPAPPIPDSEVAICTSEFSVGGRRVLRGQRLRRDDELVQLHPEWFAVPLAAQG